MKRWTRSAPGLAAALLAATACNPAPAGQDPPERIVLVVVDTLRRDHVSAYGDAVATPNIDALAREGQVFRRAFASFHQTTMTMAALFTGRTPSLARQGTRERLAWTGRTWCGMLRFADDADAGSCIPASLPTLASRLRDAGYWTAGVVTNQLLYRPGGYERGFERWEELSGFAPTAVEANRAARAVLDDRPRDRFFLYVHYMDVHDYGYRGEPYASGVSKVDWAVGDLMDALASRGLRDDALVILTSDHGERLGEAHFAAGTPGHNGNPSFDTLLAVPLIVSPAAFEDPGAPVRSDDLHRMILRAAGVGDGPEPELEPGELLLTEFRYQTWRTDRWKLFRERDTGEVHLVDLEADPGETRDVAARHPEVVDRAERRLDALTGRLGAGDVPPLELSDADRERLKALGYVVPRRR